MKNNIFINRYVMACAVSIVLALVGFISMNTLPIEQYPNSNIPTLRRRRWRSRPSIVVPTLKRL